ncbi:Anti-sigma-K factor RskA [Duganella sp. CF517]|uniref:anti-sigma factor n=1 Tax=Duganella sp. CF517 TaxID=1881038 RepID=UPI0008C93A0B|nr:anti-sigma factor [Duganella sp. CF517]SEN08605.1 Anti-sigma-K factor RskA [Duganella sp. CF517]
MNYEQPELLKKLAGAYVLGTMAARARPRFARLLAESPQAQRAVAEWNNQLAPLYATVPPIQPPSQVWDLIAAKTEPGAAKAAAPAATSPRGIWSRLGAALDGWGRAAVAFALGVVLTAGLVSQNAHVLGMHHMDAALPASYFGILANDQGEAVLSAGSHRRGKTIKIKLLKPLAIPAGSVARLWALPNDGAPVAIANVPASGAVIVDLDAPAEDIFAKVSRLGVTFETDPAAKQPGTPFVLLGHCVKFW